MIKLEKCQKKAVTRILGSRNEPYIIQLRMMNVLPPSYVYPVEWYPSTCLT